MRYKADKYKEPAASGHRMGEKRTSMCEQQTPSNRSNHALMQTQQHVEREKTIKIELIKKIQELEDVLRKSDANYNKRLEAEERWWISQSNEQESEYQEKISYLAEKIIQAKENRIKVNNSMQATLIHITNIFLYIVTGTWKQCKGLCYRMPELKRAS